MAQAVGGSSTRRDFIKSTGAAVPAIALGGLVPSPALAGSSYPEHARRLLAVYDRWLAKVERDAENTKTFRARIFELTGLEYGQWPRPYHDDATFSAAFKLASHELHHEDCDEHGCSIEWGAIHEVLYALCDEIAALPIRSIGDLALRTRAVALANAQYWLGDEEESTFSEFVDAVAEFAGIDAMPGLSDIG